MKSKLMFLILTSLTFGVGHATTEPTCVAKFVQEGCEVGNLPNTTSTTNYSKNLLNESDPDFSKGFYLNGKGELRPNDDYASTGFIPFTKEMGVLTSSVAGSLNASGGGYICLYDSEKRVVAGASLDEWKGRAFWQTGVAYARFSIRRHTLGKLQVEAGNEVSDYVLFQDVDAADVNRDGLINSTDVVYIYNQIMCGSNTDDANRPNQNAVGQTSAKLVANEQIVLKDFPWYIKKGNHIDFYAKFSSLDTLFIGKGLGEYRGGWIVIDKENVSLWRHEAADILVEQIPHNLNLQKFVNVEITVLQSGRWNIYVRTETDKFECNTSRVLFEANGCVFAQAKSPLTDVKLYATNSDLNQTVWAFGDSYFGVSPDRWVGVVRQMGYFNFLVDGLAGLKSDRAYADLLRALTMGRPKYLLWCLGMNDTDEMFKTYFELVRAKCEGEGITLICATIPTVPNHYKEKITEYVKTSGVRYVDFYKAVGTNSKGEWHEGYLEDRPGVDPVHPTELGAQALARQVLIDVPEFEEYCKTK